MGSPLRFFGADEPFEIDGVVIPARCAVEVTFGTHQQRFLVRPDGETRELLLGCFGRAYARYPSLRVAVLNVLSNHGCFVAMPDSAFVLSSFMRDFLSTAAVRLNGHRERTGTFWERRYRAIPIADEAALEDRFRYVLTQGTKENLVWNAGDWPGVTSIRALQGGPPLIGRWRDRSAEYERRRQRNRRVARATARCKTLSPQKLEPLWREYPIPLMPLPHWESLPVGNRRAIVADMVRDDALRTRQRHERDGTRPLGAAACLRTDPFSQPAVSKRSPAPLCHATCTPVRRAFRQAYQCFVERVRASTADVARLVPTTRFPLGATVPPIYCRHPAPIAPRDRVPRVGAAAEATTRPPANPSVRGP